MYQEFDVDVDSLQRMVEINEQVPDESFSMSTWRSEWDCGTTHCLVGNFCNANSCDDLRFTKYGIVTSITYNEHEHGIISVASRFGMHWAIADFIFSDTSARLLCKTAAIKRLQMTVNYYRRKQALLRNYLDLRRMPRKQRMAIQMAPIATAA